MDFFKELFLIASLFAIFLFTPIAVFSATTTFSLEIKENTLSRAPASLRRMLAQFDIDGNGWLELSELLDMVTKWFEYFKRRHVSTEGCDLNNDSYCDLVDISILLYYIGR